VCASWGAVVLLFQTVFMERNAEKRVLKVLVDWPAGDVLGTTARGERMCSTVDVHIYLQGIASMVSLRHTVALKSTASGALASIKRALAVCRSSPSPCSLFPSPLHLPHLSFCSFPP
jgi:hypothetical protein